MRLLDYAILVFRVRFVGSNSIQHASFLRVALVKPVFALPNEEESDSARLVKRSLSHCQFAIQ
jgi:hypothetical protein